ncbi:MAG: hypothetical protein VB861_06155 [Planctomycetaceae bacterium]
MIARRFTVILLLLIATGIVAAPKHANSPAGRQAFDRCIASAQVAWRSGRTNEALRWYHTAKNLARAHNLTLSRRDVSLIDLVIRHEAGLVGPQPGQLPGCGTDAIAKRPKATPRDALPGRRLSGPNPAINKVIPSPQSIVNTQPQPATRTIPRETVRVLKPPVDETPTGQDPATDRPDGQTVDKAVDKAEDKPDNQAESQPQPLQPPGPPEPAPPVWPEPEGDADQHNTDDDLVPPVTPPLTSAPPAPPRPPRVEPALSIESGDTTNTPPTPISTSSTPAIDHAADPIRLTADEAAVPITLAEPPSQGTLPPSETSEPDAHTTFLGITADQQLILWMFGPIVIALFVLGLLTQEMPGPVTILGWVFRSHHDTEALDPAQTDPTTNPVPELDSLSASPPESASTPALLSVTFGTSRRNKVAFYTATIQLPGLEPARVVKRRDGSPLFRSRGAAASSATHVARQLGFDGITEPKAALKAA